MGKYTLRNKSLDHIFKQYNTTNLLDLDDDQLKDICKELRIVPAWVIDKDNPSRTKGLDVTKTVQVIKLTTEVSCYMPDAFWNTKHRELAERTDLMRTLAGHSSGDETFEAMQELEFGVSKLQAGQSKDINVSKDWIEEDLLKSPVASKLEIKDEQGNLVTLEPVQASVSVVEAVKAVEDAPRFTAELPNTKPTINPQMLGYADLQKLVAEKVPNIKVVGMSKNELMDAYTKHLETIKV